MKAKLEKNNWTRNIIRIALIVILVSILAVTIISCRGIVRGSGKVTSEDRSVSGFNKVSVSGSGNLHIAQGDEEFLTIEAEDNILPLITAKVSGDTLKIGFKPGTSISTTKSIEFYLIVKDLDSISASGSGNIDCLGLTADNLIIKTSGSRNVDMSNLEVNSIALNSSGSGNITLAGITDSQSIKTSGSIKYFGEGLESKSCVINSSGSGELIVSVSDDLNIDASGSIKITYLGSPSITQKTSGSASINSK
ncbi:MAG: head GIN domain-containing protein [Candidatus Humimicrobiaceae bacterium]